jgi:hypothetical protein
MATQPRVAGTKKWDQYAKGIPTDLSTEQREVRVILMRISVASLVSLSAVPSAIRASYPPTTLE